MSPLSTRHRRPPAWNPGASGTRGVLTAEALGAGLAIGGDFQAPAAPPTAASPCFPGAVAGALRRNLFGLDPVDPETPVDAEPAVESPVAG
jgi:hypothetical protein